MGSWKFVNDNWEYSAKDEMIDKKAKPVPIAEEVTVKVEKSSKKGRKKKAP